MAGRCPTARALGSTKLKGYQFLFRSENAGAVATIMALERAIRNQGGGGSVYDERGLVIL